MRGASRANVAGVTAQGDRSRGRGSPRGSPGPSENLPTRQESRPLRAGAEVGAFIAVQDGRPGKRRPAQRTGRGYVLCLA